MPLTLDRDTEAYTDWLAALPWEWRLTLTVAGGRTTAEALLVNVADYVNALADAVQGPVAALAVAEDETRGPPGWHAHVMLADYPTGPATPTRRRLLERRWRWGNAAARPWSILSESTRETTLRYAVKRIRRGDWWASRSTLNLLDNADREKASNLGVRH